MKYFITSKRQFVACQSCDSGMRAKARLIARIMKLTTVFILLLTAGVFASGKAQRVTLSMDQASIKEVLTELKKQTDYRFLYREDILEKLQPVTVHVTGKPLDEVLEQLFRDEPVSYRKRNGTITIMEKRVPRMESFPVQQPEVRGVVRDSLSALAGVSVRVKGNSQGTLTDAEGRFSLVAPGDAVLVFTFVGYIPEEVSINNRQQLQVTLRASTETLEDVVVVGYGTQKKINLTGAVDVVSGEQLANRPAANVSLLLQGASPNMNINLNSFGGEPGATQNWQIRGVGSISGNTMPNTR